MKIDRISVSDLELFGDAGGSGGVVSLFERSETDAGRAALHRRLGAPSTDIGEIVRTQAAVRFFRDEWRSRLLTPRAIEGVARYLSSNIDLGRHASAWSDAALSLWLPLRDRDLCRELKSGVSSCVALLSESERLSRSLLAANPPEVVRGLARRLEVAVRALAPSRHGASLFSAIRADRALRGTGADRVREVVDCLAELDALRTMGATSRALGWTFPELVASERFLLEGEGLYHPFLREPIGNPVRIAGGEPVVFLTGPNMAGKTTYMRALGLAVLLAQVGMTVPASRFRVTPVDVLLTSLNPTDNLRAGLSYFFAEVLRVKEAAGHLAGGRRCLVLFDEVFKGTNVKDALEASLAVISGFARAHGSGCVFASHLVELAPPLSELGRVSFFHFEGEVVDGKARYSYELRPGVSDQRFGLQLLEEARVPELLDRIGSRAT